MMTKIYLDLSDDIREELEENHISISDILTERNLEHNINYEQLPGQQDTGVRTRNLVQVILTNPEAAVAIILALDRLFKTFLRRPRLIEVINFEEIRDADGNVLRDNEGKPLFKEVKKVELLEPRPENNEFELEVPRTGNNLFKVRSTSNQISDKDK